MARRPRFLVDTDEVLADFKTPALQLMEQASGKSWDLDSMTKWDIFEYLDPKALKKVRKWIEKPGFCTSLKPLPDAQVGIEVLRETFDVYVVTSPLHSKTWVWERDTWLHKHFGFTRSQIIHTSAKYTVVGDVLLDDKPDTIVKWQIEHPGKLGLLWHLANTKTLGLDDVRVKTWDEVILRAEGHIGG